MLLCLTPAQLHPPSPHWSSTAHRGGACNQVTRIHPEGSTGLTKLAGCLLDRAAAQLGSFLNPTISTLRTQRLGRREARQWQREDGLEFDCAAGGLANSVASVLDCRATRHAPSPVVGTELPCLGINRQRFWFLVQRLLVPAQSQAAE